MIRKISHTESTLGPQSTFESGGRGGGGLGFGMYHGSVRARGRGIGENHDTVGKEWRGGHRSPSLSAARVTQQCSSYSST